MKLELQFLVNKHNEHQIPRAESFAREVKASLILKSMQVIDGHDAGEWIPSERTYARYEMTGNRFAIKNAMPSRCLRLWLNPVITGRKGTALLFDKVLRIYMATFSTETFREIWHEQKFRDSKEVLSRRNQYLSAGLHSGIGMLKQRGLSERYNNVITRISPCHPEYCSRKALSSEYYSVHRGRIVLNPPRSVNPELPENTSNKVCKLFVVLLLNIPV
jgi:hypothetical protein